MKTTGLVFISFYFSAITCECIAQDAVSIGITKADDSSILHVESPTKNQGLLIPRLSSDPANNTVSDITNPSDGMVVYDTYKNGFIYWDESLPNGAFADKWVEVIPQGLIMIWSGTNPPKGWAICNGSLGTPNLSSRFVVSYSSSDLVYQNPGNKSLGGNQEGARGGTSEVLLTANETGNRSHDHSMNHNHEITDPGHTHQIDNHGPEDVADANKQNAYNRNANAKITSESAVTGVSINAFTGNTGSVSANNAVTPHENRPPFYALAYIMKL